MKKILFIAMAILATLIGIYPVIYLLLDRHLTFLNNKPEVVLQSTIWNIAFYAHIFTGGVALLTGWVQFSRSIRQKNLSFHRTIGKIYVTSVLLSAIGAIYIGFFALGGPIAACGFICLGLVWFYTTLSGFIAITNKNIEKHRKLMTYSYAVCFTAVMLRLWLPILTLLIHDYICAYIISAWLCWVPNLIIAYLINRWHFGTK